MAHGGRTRNFRLHVPTDLGERPVPLVIQLHGGGGAGRGIDRLTRFHDLADHERFVVVAPSGVARNWNDGRIAPRMRAAMKGVDDVGFIATLIDSIAARAPIDRRRVYGVGMSNGAMMAGRLACQLSERIAAIAQIAGTAAADAAQWCHPGRPVPVMQIHGTADPLVPYEGGPLGGGRHGRRRLQGRLEGRGVVMGVDDWASLWVANNNADGPAVSNVGDDVSVRTWRGTDRQSDLEFWRIEHGGHTWPGGSQYLPERVIGPTSKTFDATPTIWRFLSAHALD
ncbi:MAG TPA: PHB depolymerase family esterase [Acidimicrobiia bacterium]|nr:PHB depolymerase family esterase [Acidimicrobiia bacterium]